MTMGIANLSLAVDRTLWFYEQFSEVPTPTRFEKARYQLSLSGTNYADTISSQVSGNLDVGPFEISGLYSKRSFLELNDRGRDTRTAFAGIEESFGLELGRYFSTAKQNYGRVSIGYYNCPNRSLDGIRLVLSTGVLSIPAVPWDFHFRLAGFIPVKTAPKQIMADVTVLRSFEEFQVGAAMGLVYQNSDDVAPARYQSMLLSLGPQAKFALGPTELLIAAKWRLFLDKELFIRNANLATANPSEFAGTPDLNLRWSYLF